ncbi:hypothetical protein ACFL6Y_02765 [Elusimicrobiota bacterium]
MTAEGIVRGIVLRFDAQRKLKRKIEHYLVIRSSIPREHAIEASSQSVKYPYYHDWHKDYFTKTETGQTFYYHVRAVNRNGDVIAYSEPYWQKWKVAEMPFSGVMLTPSAYRRVPIYDSPYSEYGTLFPMNIDIVTSYYIGRLYSYNRLSEITNRRKSLFTRVGVWFIQLEGKIILEKERRFIPQLAIGGDGSYMLRDTKAPGLSNPTFQFKVGKESSRPFNSLFCVASKKFWFLKPSVGLMRGSSPSKIIYLTEFLSKESESNVGIFYSLKLNVSRKLAFFIEMIEPRNAKSKPFLVNAQVGSFLHANFDLAYLKYSRGYDVLGHLNFRFTFYPKKRVSDKKK